MAATAQEVQKLREKTGAGFMDCKAALESSSGDLEKAIQFLREKGKMSAAQKAGRSAGQGVACVWLSPDQKKGGMVELNCETDFVARTDEFTAFAKNLARYAGSRDGATAEVLLSATLDGSKETVDAVLKEKIGRLGENMKLRRAVSLGGSDTTLVGHYVHAGFEKAPECGTLGVLVGVRSDKDTPEIRELLKELSMQVAAASPKWIRKEEVPAEIVKKEAEIYKEQCRQSGKPEKAWDKIIENKTLDFYRQFCLLEQAYVRDPKTSVQSYLQSVTSKLGAALTVTRIARFKVGEDL